MQSISDDLLALIADRLQVGSDRAYGCKVEIDYLVAGSTSIGATVDLNALYATITNAPDNVGDPLYPANWDWQGGPLSNITDGSTISRVYVPWTSATTYRHRLISDLGSAFVVETAWIYGSGEQFDYSDDGSTWTAVPGSWANTTDALHTGAAWRKFTISGGPLTHRYWRYGYTGSGIHVLIDLYSFEIWGESVSIIPPSLGTVTFRVSDCSLDKSRRMTAAQADITIPVPDGQSGTAWLSPDGTLQTNAPLRIFQGYGDPADWPRTFTGSIDEITESRDARSVHITARDMMKRLIEQDITLTAPQGADEAGAVRTTANYVYLGMDVDAILDDLLDKAGVPTADRNIAATSYAIDEFLGADGASFADTIIGDDRLTGLTGYDLWADELGVLQFQPSVLNRSADSDTAPVADYSYVLGSTTPGSPALESALVTQLDHAVDEYDLRTRVKIRGNIAIAIPAWTQEWSSGTLTLPVGIMYAPADSTHIYVLDRGTKKIYRLKEADGTKEATGIWPLYIGGSVTYPIGLSRDPADSDRFWVLEAPYWTTGSTTGNKIHKFDLSDGSHLASYTIADGKWTSIKVSSANIWLTNWTTDKVHKHSKTDGSSVASYTVTYGTAQVNPTGVFVDGTTLGVFFYGTARFLLVDESDPTTIDPTNALGITSGVVSTAGTKILGGEINTDSHAVLYADSDALHTTWKFTLTTPSTDEVWAEAVDTALEDELGFLMSAADREHDTHPGDADHAFEIRRATIDVSKLLSNLAQATETAQRQLAVLAHRREVLDLGSVGNPALQRADLVSVTDAVTGIDTLWVADTLRSVMDERGYFQTLALLPYEPSF